MRELICERCHEIHFSCSPPERLINRACRKCGGELVEFDPEKHNYRAWKSKEQERKDGSDGDQRC
ncbi:MAG: hypothetical protein WC364_04765 [Eubacteriales bacterium]|jgi:cytochrome c5